MTLHCIKICKVKKCFLIITVVLLLNFLLTTISKPYPHIQNLAEEALESGARDPRFAEVYRIKTHLSKDMKYILLWTSKDHEPFYSFKEGQRTFLNRRCPNINCYVTFDRTFFGDNLEKFDAIIFNGRNIPELNGDIPKYRSSNQKYIYLVLESPGNYPICSNKFDNFFNWTASYRFDSDILLRYFLIKDSRGRIIGPSVDMKWTEPDKYLDKDFENILLNKTKAAAWFVSNCDTIGKREKYVAELVNALKVYNLTVDMYGKCGKQHIICHRNENNKCLKKIEKDYFFYLAFENSIDKDYVTEKLLTGLQHKAIPIVYGGANYSRFSPPGSYINARSHTPKLLAKIMANLIASPDQYKQYFKWYKSYSFEDSGPFNECEVCKALNNKSMVEKKTVYSDFRKWWNNPKETSLCSTGFFNYIKSFYE